MKFSCTFGFVHPDHLVEMAVVAEEAGFDEVTIADHVVHPVEIESEYPYSPDGSRYWDHRTPWPDPWVAIMAMAANTTRLRFGHSVYILAMRDPFSVAKSSSTCARLSGNRVSLGIGLGWMKEEYELLGNSFAERGARTDEMVTVLKKLWTGDAVEHHGRFFDFAPLSVAPGVEEPIPIVVGGVSRPAMRRVAKLGDAWAPFGLPVAELGAAIVEIRRLMGEEGREKDALGVYAACPDANDIDGYKRMEEVGVSHVVTKPWALYSPVDQVGIGSLSDMKDGLKRFGDDVISKF
jgi:probable F420-dependent oxidoreductase